MLKCHEILDTFWRQNYGAARQPKQKHRNDQHPTQKATKMTDVNAALQQLPPPAEDAAGEGGEAVATFSNYNAPAWARRAATPPSPTGNASTAKPTPTTSTPVVLVLPLKKVPDEGVIVIDSDDEDELEIVQDEKDADVPCVPFDNTLSHSSPACESGLLASVNAPSPNKECLSVIGQLAQEGKLSALQVEGAGLAIQRHCRLLKREDTIPGAKSRRVRAGFFLGDGAGIGKGRQIAAVLRDSLSRSVKDSVGKNVSTRRRHLWLSVSRELVEDARRDLEDIGCYAPVIDGADALGGNSKGGSGDQSGVLFITYALLVSGKGKRMEDIISWLTRGQSQETFEGCIIFDEAHKAKNLCADPPTATGKLVMALQERLPNARVMYCSATGVSDLKQMAYAVRLGLWGPGTNFATFDIFRASLEKRGVGAMELLALEMKQAGCFVARTLSWDGAEFDSVKVALSPHQVQVYDQSMRWWELVKTEIRSALATPGMNGTPKMLWSQFWSAMQRFSKELAICAKVPLVAEDALKQLESGHSIVIGLQSTGEASTQATLQELQSKLAAEMKPFQDLEDVPLTSILSTAAAIMAGFVRNFFPVAPLPQEPMKVPSIPSGGFMTDSERALHQQITMLNDQMQNLAPPEPKHELLVARQRLLDAIENIDLPPAPLDDLIDRLGGINNVAEMTGRSGRVIRESKSNTFRFVKRISASKENKKGLSMPVSQEDADRLNITEKKKFMDGRKKVAIISDAASTGISLHAAAKCESRDRRRVHYTIELPWAAGKYKQRSHMILFNTFHLLNMVPMRTCLIRR